MTRTAQWAVNAIDKWYPATRDKRKRDTHFAEAFAESQAGESDAVFKLIKLAKDASQPEIIRATALNLLTRYMASPQTLDVISSSLQDNDPLVRYEAVSGIPVVLPRTAGIEAQRQKIELLVPLLDDPIRAVRTEVARVLTEVPAELFGKSQRQDFEVALEEFKQRQQAISDRPEAHLNLGVMYQNMGQIELAETSYKTSIKVDEHFVQSRFNLANLYNAQGRNKEAEYQLNQIIERVPDYGEAHYSLGLLLAEMQASE